MRSSPQCRPRRVAVTVLSLVAGLALAACGSSDSSSGGAESVNFGVGDPQLQVATAPYVSVPEVQGYWRQAGLNVETQGTKGAVASVQGLLSGQFDIVNGGSSAFYDAAAKSPDLRVISLGAGNIWQTAVPKGSPIRSLQDLQGKKIGAQSLASSSFLFGRAGLASAGVDPDSVTWMPVGVGAQAAQALKSGKIDAYASYQGPLGVVSSLMGGSLRPLPSPLDRLTGTLGLATTQDFLEEHRDVVVRFLQAYNMGKIFADTNPKAAIQIHWKMYPGQKPGGVSDQQAVADTLPIVKDRWATDAVPGPRGLVGYLNTDQIRASIGFFRKYGLIENDVPADQVAAMGPARKAAQTFPASRARSDAKSWTP